MACFTWRVWTGRACTGKSGAHVAAWDRKAPVVDDRRGPELAGHDRLAREGCGASDVTRGAACECDRDLRAGQASRRPRDLREKGGW